jgi:hypothetical protein
MKQAQGFVAGTLVHTDKGLVPIEQIKVGDRVLSKPESGESEQAYKPVTNVFKSENMPILQMSYYDALNPMDDLKAKLLYLTEGHLIWVVTDENDNVINDWMPAQDIVGGSKVILKGGVLAEIGNIIGVWTIDRQNIGYINDCMEEYPEIVVDFSGGKIQSYHVAEYFSGMTSQFSDETLVFDDKTEVIKNYLDFVESGDDFYSQAYRATVYNFEVSDYHSYFVGDGGIWVHHANGYLTQ